MNPGTLLHRFDWERIWNLLRDANTPWTSIRLDHQQPVLERCYTQYGDLRLGVHRIHPCETAMYHPHPWPSAVYLLDGEYEMAIGHGEGSKPPPEAMRTVVTPGSRYEMLDPNGWHYVRPLVRPTLSIMLNGPAWKPSRADAPVKVPHTPLDSDTRDSIIDFATIIASTLAYQQRIDMKATRSFFGGNP